MGKKDKLAKQRKQVASGALPDAAPGPSKPGASEHWDWLAAGFLILLFAGRLFSTAKATSATYDEAFYIAYGHSLHKTGDYRMSIDKPPLVPWIAALPLRFSDLKFDTTSANWKNAALWTQAATPWKGLNDYRWNIGLDFLHRNTLAPDVILFRARGALIVFHSLIACALFFAMRRALGAVPALFFLLFYTFCPNVLGHGALATEDAIVAPLFFLACALCWLFLAEGDLKIAAALGAATGLTLVSKHTGLLLPPIFLWLLLLKRQRFGPEMVKGFALAAAAAVLVVAVSYRFTQFPFYFYGIRNTLAYHARGQLTFCLGKISNFGFWYYYLVVLGVKLAVPLLALPVVEWLPLRQATTEEKKLVAALTVPIVLIVALGSMNKIQLGVRYVLPVVPFLAALAALAASRRLWLGASLALWGGASSLWAHPNYIAYFNELSGGSAHGIKLLSDSNLDWGQDLKLLQDYMKAQDAEVILSYYGASVPESIGFAFQDFYSFGVWGLKDRLNSAQPKRELLAVSATNLQGVYLSKVLGPDPLAWLRSRAPMARLGYSIYLYDVTADAAAHEWLAHDYLLGGAGPQAWRETQRALALKPNSTWARLVAALLLASAERGDDSLRLFKTFENADPKTLAPWKEAITTSSAQILYGRSLAVLAWEARRRGRKDDARRAAALALAVDPGNSSAKELMGVIGPAPRDEPGDEPEE